MVKLFDSSMSVRVYTHKMLQTIHNAVFGYFLTQLWEPARNWSSLIFRAIMAVREMLAFLHFVKVPVIDFAFLKISVLY